MKQIIIGFTGTRIGMTENQKLELSRRFSNWITDGYLVEFHHGACMGADAEADMIARNHGIYGKCMHIHPSNSKATRVNCEEPGDIVYQPKSPLVRDRDIVDSVDILYAAPKDEKREEVRSGTWTTVRYARKSECEVVLLKR